MRLFFQTNTIRAYKEIRLIIDGAKLLSFSGANCVLCSQKMRNICNYCIIKEIFIILQRYNSYSLEDFAIAFDYIPYRAELQKNKEAVEWN